MKTIFSIETKRYPSQLSIKGFIEESDNPVFVSTVSLDNIDPDAYESRDAWADLELDSFLEQLADMYFHIEDGHMIDNLRSDIFNAVNPHIWDSKTEIK
jgi:hypothetical protein